MKCDLCDNPATVHLTQITNGQIQKVDLCEPCAQKKGISSPEGVSLMDMLYKGTFVPDDTEGASECSQCGCSLRQFKQSGRLGCAACYSAFKKILESMIRGVQIGMKHVGKVPVRGLKSRQLSEKLESLRAQIETAVEQEAFEEAAKLRDEMHLLEKNDTSNSKEG